MKTTNQLNQMPDFKARRPNNEVNLLLHLVDLPIYSRILDVGCGNAHYSSLARAIGHKVHAFDISPGLLNQAIDRFAPEATEEDLKYLSSMGHKKPKYITPPKIWMGDANQAINYVSGPYDAILCLGGTLELLEKPERALQLMMDSLSRDGKLFLEIENRRKPKYLFGIIKDLMKREISLRLAWLLFTGFKSKAPLQFKRTLTGRTGARVNLRFKLLPLEMIQEIAHQNNCEVDFVEGQTWCADLFPNQFPLKDSLERLLSRVFPFNRASSILWVEIKRVV